jgi:uncharacterized delta-60 repeat protein
MVSIRYTITQLYNYTIGRFNADGKLDSSYGANGIAIHNLPPGACNDIIIQSDDKLVAVGAEIITRFLDEGKLDSTFGINGFATTAAMAMNCLVLQPDGKIIAGGSKWAGPYYFFALMRWTPYGSVDSSFGMNGLVTTILNANQQSRIESLVIQPDGKIVAAGICIPGTGVVVRYNSNGSIDSTFGLYGSNQNLWGTGSGPTSICLQSDGKILITGNGTKALRLNNNGLIDSSFGSSGIIKIAEGFSHSKDVIIDSFKRIVLVGDTGNGPEKDFLIAMYDSNGVKLDSILTDFIGYEETQAGWIQKDQKIVVAGFNRSGLTGGNSVFAMARYEYSIELAIEAVKVKGLVPFPNPATTTLSLQSENSFPPLTTFQLFDITGRMVLQQELSGNTNRIDVSAVSRGMYLYNVLRQAQHDTERLGAGKVIIE